MHANLLVTPAQLMRPHIGQNPSCIVGNLGLYLKGDVVCWLFMYAIGE